MNSWSGYIKKKKFGITGSLKGSQGCPDVPKPKFENHCSSSFICMPVFFYSGSCLGAGLCLMTLFLKPKLENCLKPLPSLIYLRPRNPSKLTVAPPYWRAYCTFHLPLGLQDWAQLKGDGLAGVRGPPGTGLSMGNPTLSQGELLCK